MNHVGEHYQIDCPYCHQTMRQWYFSTNKLGFFCGTCPQMVGIYISKLSKTEGQITCTEFYLDEYETPGRRCIRVYPLDKRVELHQDGTIGIKSLIMEINYVPSNLDPQNVHELWDRLTSIQVFS